MYKKACKMLTLYIDPDFWYGSILIASCEFQLYKDLFRDDILGLV